MGTKPRLDRQGRQSEAYDLDKETEQMSMYIPLISQGVYYHLPCYSQTEQMRENAIDNQENQMDLPAHLTCKML